MMLYVEEQSWNHADNIVYALCVDIGDETFEIGDHDTDKEVIRKRLALFRTHFTTPTVIHEGTTEANAERAT